MVISWGFNQPKNRDVRGLYPLVNWHNYGKSPCLIGKSTIKLWAMFNSYVWHNQRLVADPWVSCWNIYVHQQSFFGFVRINVQKKITHIRHIIYIIHGQWGYNAGPIWFKPATLGKYLRKPTRYVYTQTSRVAQHHFFPVSKVLDP